jgi:hypothetical protein
MLPYYIRRSPSVCFTTDTAAAPTTYENTEHEFAADYLATWVNEFDSEYEAQLNNFGLCKVYCRIRHKRGGRRENHKGHFKELSNWCANQLC